MAPEAETQLATLYQHTAEQASPAIALRFTNAIVDHCDGLSVFPNRGTPRDDLKSGFRTVVFRRRTTIAYRVLDTAVEVLGIFHGGQDYEAVLRGLEREDLG